MMCMKSVAKNVIFSMALIMKKVMIVMKYVWITLSLMTLFMTLNAYDVKDRVTSDVEIFLAYLMLILSFPIGLLCALVASLFARYTYAVWEWTLPLSYFSLILTWLIFFLPALWQWLVFFPSLINKFREDQVIIKQVITMIIMVMWIGLCVFASALLIGILLGF